MKAFYFSITLITFSICSFSVPWTQAQEADELVSTGNQDPSPPISSFSPWDLFELEHFPVGPSCVSTCQVYQETLIQSFEKGMNQMEAHLNSTLASEANIISDREESKGSANNSRIEAELATQDDQMYLIYRDAMCSQEIQLPLETCRNCVVKKSVHSDEADSQVLNQTDFESLCSLEHPPIYGLILMEAISKSREGNSSVHDFVSHRISMEVKRADSFHSGTLSMKLESNVVWKWATTMTFFISFLFL